MQGGLTYIASGTKNQDSESFGELVLTLGPVLINTVPWNQEPGFPEKFEPRMAHKNVPRPRALTQASVGLTYADLPDKLRWVLEGGTIHIF